MARTYTKQGVLTDYEVRAAIMEGRGLDFSRRLNLDDHVVESRPIELFLSTDDRSSDPLDPSKVFGRLGRAGADSVLSLSPGQSIPQGLVDVTVEVDGPASSFAVGDVVHVGREAFTVSAVDLVGSTLTLTDRGLLGTQIQSHTYDQDTGVCPFITKPAVYFTGRRVLILEGVRLADGSTAQWAERWRGFVQNEPEFGRDGAHTIKLSVAPLSALLDQPLGPSSLEVNYLHPEVHAFGGFGLPGESPRALTATAFDIGEQTERGFISMEVPVFRAELPGTLPSAVGLSGLPTLGTDSHSGISGVGFLPTGHPRTFPVNPAGGEFTVFAVNGYTEAIAETDDLANFLDIGSPGVGAAVGDGVPTQDQALGGTFLRPIFNQAGDHELVNFGGLVRSVETCEWRRRSLVDLSQFEVDGVWPQLYQWPARLVDVFNSPENGLMVRHTQTPDGGLSMCRLDLGTGEIVASLADGVRGAVSVLVTNDSALEHAAEEGDPLWSGWSWTGSEHSVRNPSELLPLEVLALTGDDGTRVITLLSDNRDRARARIPTRVARAYYARGEGYITLSRPVTIPAGGLYLEALREGDDEALAVFRIIEVSAVAHGADLVYVCRLGDPLNHTPGGGRGNQGMIPSLAEYDPHGADRVTFRSTSVFHGVPVGVLLLQLLTSSGGQGVNHPTYDALAYGAGLNALADSALGSDIDVASFLRVESSISEAEFSARWTAGQSVIEVVGGILRTCGYVIDARTDDLGRCRLAAIPLGRPNAVDVVAGIGVSDISARNNVETKTETRIRNSFKITANYDPEGEPAFQRTIKDAVSIDLFDKESALSIDLAGVQLLDGPDAVNDLIPLFTRLREQYAYPRRIYTLTLRAGLGVAAKIGGTYTVSHPQLRGDAGMGVASAFCRLRSVSGSAWAPTIKAEFMVYGSVGSGWAPSLLVDEVIDAETIRAHDATYAPVEHPTTGEGLNDVAGFADVQPGEKVTVYNKGDSLNASTKVIDSVNAADHLIVFTQPHGLSVGARVTPASRTSAADAHKVYAFQGGVVVT